MAACVPLRSIRYSSTNLCTRGLRSIAVVLSLGTSSVVPAVSLGTSCFVFGAGRAGFACAVVFPLVGDALDAGTAARAGFLGAAGVLLLLVLGAFLGAALLGEGGEVAMGRESCGSRHGCRTLEGRGYTPLLFILLWAASTAGRSQSTPPSASLCCPLGHQSSVPGTCGHCPWGHLWRCFGIGSAVPVACDLFEVRQALRKKRLHHANLPGSFDGCDVD